LVHHVSAAAAVLVVIIGLLDHRGGNIHPIDALEMPGQSLGQPPDAASEIERPPLPEAGMQSQYLLHRLLDFPNSGLEELVNIPAAALAIGIG